MTPLQAAAYFAQVSSAVSGVALARLRPAYRPAAVALVVLAAANIAHAPIAAALTPYPVEPWQGAMRWLVYVDGWIGFADYAVIAGLAVTLAVSRERRSVAVGFVACVWLLASVVLAVLYPSPVVRGAGLQRINVAADLIGLFVATTALIVRARRNIAAKLSPNGAYALVLSLVLVDAAILLAPFSPWRADLYSTSYGGIQVAIIVFFAVITTAQVTSWFHISRG